MTKRHLKVVPAFKVPDLPCESIRAYRTLADFEYDYKKLYGDTPRATRQEIAPAGWAKVKYFTDKVLMRGNSL